MNYPQRVLPLVGLIVLLTAVICLFGSQLNSAQNSIVAAPATDCGTNLIVNGSFEQGTLINPNVLPTGSTLITGWTVSQGNIDYEQEYFIASDGVRSIDLNGKVPGAIRQTFTTTPGQQYVATFDLSGNYDGGPSVKTARVQAAGQFQDFTTTRNIKLGQWGSHTFTFTPTSTSTTLEFVSLTTQFSGATNPDHAFAFGPTLDNVRVCQVSTPPTPKPGVSITQVTMFDDHTLQVDVTGEFSQDVSSQKTFSVSTTLENVDLRSMSSLTASAVGIQHHSLFIDLQTNLVPRFTENKYFQVTATANEGDVTSDPATANASILLPVVIVPGIQPFCLVLGHCDGDDGTFSGLEGVFTTAGYRLRSDFPSLDVGYPTLYTLRYATNSASFHEGASALASLIREVERRTWAGKVNIAGHSKGGLVARKFIQNEDDWFIEEKVNELVTAQSPHLGSAIAGGAGLSIVFPNLVPVWPWIRHNGQRFYMPRYEIPALLERENQELSRLNGMALNFNDPPFPASVPLIVLWSDSNQETQYTFTLVRGTYVRTDCLGDGLVPAFSQVGRMVDPNDAGTNPNDPFGTAITIPAFRNGNLQYINLPGNHFGYLNSVSAFLVDHFTAVGSQ